MKINEKYVNCLCLYDPSIEYTSGDFVVKDQVIYVVKASSVKGKDPSTGDSSYTTYLGGTFAGEGSWKSFLKGELTKDDHVSLRLLKSILDSYMAGINGIGEITGEEISPDSLIHSGTINYGMFKIKKTNQEISTLIKQTGRYEHAIIRQFTYLGGNSGSEKIRVQELFDPDYGLLYFRSCSLTGDVIGDWMLASGNLSDIRDKVMELLLTYKAKVDYLGAVEDELKSNFRYKSLFSGSTNSMILTKGSEVTSLNSQFTVSLRKFITGDMYATWQASFNPTDGIGRYKVGDAILEVSVGTPTESVIFEGGTYNSFTQEAISGDRERVYHVSGTLTTGQSISSLTPGYYVYLRGNSMVRLVEISYSKLTLSSTGASITNVTYQQFYCHE